MYGRLPAKQSAQPGAVRKPLGLKRLVHKGSVIGAFERRAINDRFPPERSLSRESRLLARLQRDGDERGTAEHHVDPDEQAERPDERPWQAGDDDTREDQIDDAVYQKPLPFADSSRRWAMARMIIKIPSTMK